MKKEKYIVIESVDFRDFTNNVNRMIEEGYKPIGGVSVSIVSNNCTIHRKYYQAMLLDTNK
jgi:hypothetical protein